MKSNLLLSLALFSLHALPASAASLAGLWEFNDGANLTQSSGGSGSLTFTGAAPAWTASVADDSATGLSGVITTAAGPANHLTVTHGIAPNGGPGAVSVNEYSFMVDIFTPAANRGAWRSIYQTAPDNNNDGDYFINPADMLGVGTLGYGATPVNAAKWSRLVVTVDLDPAAENSVVSTYLDGVLVHTHSAPQPFDGRHSLGPSVLFFADEDDENAAMNVGALAVWDGTLTAGEVSALGGAGGAVPEPSAAGLALVATAGLLARRRRK